MKNIIATAVIFTLLTAGILISINYLNKSCKGLEKQVDNLEKEVDSDKWDEAYKSSLDFMKTYKKHSDIISMFVNHQEIDNLNNELWKLIQYIKAKNKDESQASIHVMKFLLSHITEMEKVDFQNIL